MRRIRVVMNERESANLAHFTVNRSSLQLPIHASRTVRSQEHDGRLRKYYHITEKGRARIEEFRRDFQEILSIYQFITREETENE